MSQPRKSMKSFSVEKAHKIQLCLSKKIILEDRLTKHVKMVAGVDVSYAGELGIGAAVILDYESLKLLESEVAICHVRMPYIPTLLSFREILPAMAAIKKLKNQPDVFFVDAHGYAHPYRCGFASHLGLALGKPTIGVAKSRLIGKPVEIQGQKFLVDKKEVIGAVVNTKESAKPIFVSIGHMISLETSVKIVVHCSKTRIPEPILQAHILATKQRNFLARKQSKYR